MSSSVSHARMSVAVVAGGIEFREQGLLLFVIVGNRESLDLFKVQLSLAVRLDDNGAHARELQALLDVMLGFAEAGGDVGDRGALVDQIPVGVTLVRGVHVLPDGVFSKADLRGVRAVLDDLAGHFETGVDLAGLQQGRECREPAVAGDDGEFLAVLPDNERLQQAVGRDGRGQFVDALVLRLADVAFPGGELVER
jgi:hypothetical protein